MFRSNANRLWQQVGNSQAIQLYCNTHTLDVTIIKSKWLVWGVGGKKKIRWNNDMMGMMPWEHTI
jgi:hypothetical protein